MERAVKSPAEQAHAGRRAGPDASAVAARLHARSHVVPAGSSGFADAISNSPRVAAQRQQLGRMFGLEQEADVMATKPSQTPSPVPGAAGSLDEAASPLQRVSETQGEAEGSAEGIRASRETVRLNFPSSQAVLQGRFTIGASFNEYLENQEEQQKFPSAYSEAYTTVGFEHEFAQMTKDSPLAGVTHVEVARSGKKLPFTNLGFTLETDADNAVELVSPPFLVDTISADAPVPDPADIARIDGLIKTRLAAATGLGTLKSLVAGLNADPKLDLSLIDASVTSSNINPEAAGDFFADPTGKATVKHAALADAPIKASRKVGHQISISSQVNFAADARTYQDIRALSSGEASSSYENAFADVEAGLWTALDGAMNRVVVNFVKGTDGTNPRDGKMNLFLREMARVLAGQLAVPSIRRAEEIKAELFAGGAGKTDAIKRNQAKNKYAADKKDGRLYKLHTGLRSHVKDVSGGWLKDTLLNYGLGLLTARQWAAVAALTDDGALPGAIDGLAVTGTGFDKDEKKELESNLANAKPLMKGGLARIHDAIRSGRWARGEAEAKTTSGPRGQPAFGSHDPQWIGARQDTYISPDKVNIFGEHGGWNDRRLHVVEARGEALPRLIDLQLAALIRKHPAENDAQILARFTPPTGLREEEAAAFATVDLDRVKRVRAAI